MSLNQFRTIPSDVISTLGEYMTNQELFHRRGSDRIWDVEYQERIESMTSSELGEEIQSAIELDDAEYLRDLIRSINTVTPRQLRLAKSNGSFKAGRVLLDIWARTPILNHSIDYPAIDLVRSMPKTVPLSDAILDKVLTVFSNGISLYLRSFGVTDIWRLIYSGMTRGLRSNQYLIELLRSTVEGEPSDNWISEVASLAQMIRTRGENINELTQAIGSYDGEISGIITEYQERLSDIVSRM